MKTAVIYQSRYGSTETYARWIAEDLQADLLQTHRIKAADLEQYETIVYGGGLYAGGVNGISLLTKNFDSIRDKNIYLFTVGAADVTDPENTNKIRGALEQVLSPAMQNVIHIYHFRGGMHYSKLSFVHRTMMNMMVKMVSKKPESELDAEDRMMVDTYGRDIDFADRQTIAPMIADIRNSAGAKMTGHS